MRFIPLPLRQLPLLLLPGLLLPTAPPPLGAQSPSDFFESQVRPILAENCVSCHARIRRGGLRVDTRAALLAGGRSGPAIVPGDPDASLLVRVVRHEIPDLAMPVDQPALTARQVEALIQWIRMDAPWPEEAGAISEVVAVTAMETLSPSARLFVDRVQPVLVQSCGACHTGEERGGLRVDSRARLLQGGSRGPAVIPGDPDASLLMAALRHTHPELRMPRNGDRLSENELEAFAEWIRSGAEWGESGGPLLVPRRGVTGEERAFWSFRHIENPTIPPPAETLPGGSDWARTEIDRFVQAQYAKAGLSPVREAGKRELIRRATFDLIGLPPTPAEVEAFLADSSEDAFERVIDRLLESEHYGERWGRRWLDVTRFGEDDTRGLANDGSGRERYPMAYLHRDWVVKAFNEDMPYDRFVLGHLAADLLHGQEREELLPGLGFLGQGPWYYDLADPPIARADERHDRVDVTTRAFLGLTVGCARCHDHKYDPIGIHDYYAVAGIFNNTWYEEYPVAEPEVAERFKKDQEFIKSLEEGLREYLTTESTQLAQVLALQSAQYMLAAWRVTGKEQLPMDRAAAQGRLDLETLQRWIDFLGEEPRHFPFLVEWQAMVADRSSTEEKAKEMADGLQRLILEIVGEQKKLEERNQKIIARGTPLEEVKSTPMPNGFESFFDEHQLELETMDRERFNFYTHIFRFNLDNELDTFFPKPALLRFGGWGLERQLSRVAMDHVTATRETIKKLKDELPDVPFVMGVREKEPEEIDDIPLHIRGNPLELGERVPRAFPRVLEGEDGGGYTEGSGRLQLARDIIAHPLTARVIVNRVWGWHMGGGIVRTQSNFGFAGEEPTNPELLEYLAHRFLEEGMSVKALHREIMRSSVYRLASDENPTLASIDGDNRYFWRFNPQRLDAEGIRDAILAVAGNLDPKVGGPSMVLDDEKNLRRTVYSEVSRFQLHEYLQTFDFPNPSLSAEGRYTTNVPLQGLYFLNSPFVRRQAETLARRLAQETRSVAADAEDSGPETLPASTRGRGAAGSDSLPLHFDDRAMILRAYPLLYGREGSEEEVALGLRFLAAQRAAWLEEGRKGEEGSTPPEASEEEGKGEEKGREEEEASLQAWTQYARALLSAAEFRYVH